ncbi:MazG family protein [Paenibacillus chitinolyticus]|uniref:MazG family protein n=1 Tax=Paenibacillus chitinolyticus TaxID=79263 RepID=A0A410WQP2_9BACL|nr:nucleoside triphosphate pyrophosphohydrolase [Paenibacillus chitinolyticus]MCY9592429.1 nucleoside triphosphate pyrophosphohydrolase [Paenibacillus chitinolyticus]MCY9599015.1 nucleoside triphosphate pyrophosphohydrolase [Paenibacillus chitinolyticus]QAV16748.1 MazG family protein [Paenibacillus chitinolyticus]
MTQGITVLGLGSGDENQLTLGVLRRLQQAPKLILRTDHHPVAAYLRAEGIRYETFDAIYEAKDRFDDTYEAIAASLLESARSQAVVYAVPGHPMVAEYTVQLLRAKCPEAGIPLEIVGGESFLDQAFLRFGFDPIEGMQLLDATDLRPGMLNPRLHTVIGQVYDTFTASDVKLTLMELYPDDYTVFAGHSLGVAGEESVVRVPLYELDRIEGYGNLSLVWVPRSDRDELRNRTLERLHEIVAILRSPEGCPWDREQTHASLRKNLIEEAYEVLETIDEDDPDHMCEELGDLLLQVMLHSQMEEETGAFTVYDVIAGLNEKLIRRHPHVFGTEGAENAEEALANWQQMKDEEKRRKGIDPSKQSALAGVPKDLPALMKALKLQKKAAVVGFDWSEVGEVIAKITEELGEVQEAMENGAAAERLDELGDLLFAVVNLSRFLKIDPEEALASTNRKFVRRFQYIEERLEARGKSLAEADLAEMEELWQEAKKLQST